jgi:hypothetical protein
MSRDTFGSGSAMVGKEHPQRAGIQIYLTVWVLPIRRLREGGGVLLSYMVDFDYRAKILANGRCHADHVPRYNNDVGDEPSIVSE